MDKVEIENQKTIKNNDCKEIKNEEVEINKEPVKSSQVLKFKKLLPFEQEFIVNSSFLLTYFRDFKWVNWIKIAVFSNELVNKLTNGTDIVLLLGGSVLERYTINQSTLFEDEYFKIPVDFFNNHFYIFHDFKINILSDDMMFKIIINGNDFTKKLPKAYLENKMIIECDHDPKYFINDINNIDVCLFTWRIMHGLTGSTKMKKPSIDDLISWNMIENKFNEYKKNGKVINTNSFDEYTNGVLNKKTLLFLHFCTFKMPLLLYFYDYIMICL
jgi:hypothetical protein